jgi:hypothetical protein
MSKWTAHWLEAGGSLRPWRKSIETDIATARARCASVLPLPRLDVLIQCTRGTGIPGLGLNGMSHRADLISLMLDPEMPELEASMASGLLAQVIVHEVNHSLRMAHGLLETSLGGRVIAEGLADHFVRQLFPEATPSPWTLPLSEDEEAALLPRFALERHDWQPQDSAWLFGDEKGFPRQAGYRLGFALVGRFLAARPELRAHELIHHHTEKILDAVLPNAGGS